MTTPHRPRHVDLGLRAAGIFLCAIAYVAITRLFAMHGRPQALGAVAYGLATVGFLGASAGTAMTVLGHHLFDEIVVSQRWRHAPRVTKRPSGFAEPVAAMQGSADSPSPGG